MLQNLTSTSGALRDATAADGGLEYYDAPDESSSHWSRAILDWTRY
jgi:hypothetical protein